MDRSVRADKYIQNLPYDRYGRQSRYDRKRPAHRQYTGPMSVIQRGTQMSVGFVKSIAALLVGTGFAMAQSPAPAVGQSATSGSATSQQVTTHTDVSYPQTSTQMGYTGTLPGETPHGLAVPEGGFGGVHFDMAVAQQYRVYAAAEFLLWNI